MPLYSFESADGEQIERIYVAGEAPHLGEWTEIDGKSYRRIIEMPQIADSKGDHSYRLHSEAAPPLSAIEYQERRARALQARGLNEPMPVRAPAYDEVGRAVFRSPQELQEYAKRDGRFVVGDVKGASQDHARIQPEQRRAQLASVKENAKMAAMPEVE